MIRAKVIIAVHPSKLYLEREYSTVPMGVPVLPEMSGMDTEERAFSSIGIPTCRTVK